MKPWYFKSLLVAMTFGVLSTDQALATIWNVNPQGTGDFPTIQAAYDGASAGDVIMLAPGVYIDANTRVLPDYFANFPETVNATAFAKAGVNLESSAGAEQTIIDAEGVRHGIVGLDLGSVAFRGISFINATTSASGGGFSKWGGGILVYRSAVTIENCRFVDCTSPAPPGGAGAGVFLGGGSNAVFRGNLFLRGYTSQLGGGIELFQHSNALIENNTFVDNYSLDVGAGILINMTSATVSNNIFANNEAILAGAGITCLNGSSVTGECNLFWENDASRDIDVDACAIVIGSNNNIVANPLFCDAAHDVFTIRDDSPASPGDPSGCGLRGAYMVGCGSVSIEATSWGGIKARYR